jgi:uncharacterized protein
MLELVHAATGKEFMIATTNENKNILEKFRAFLNTPIGGALELVGMVWFIHYSRILRYINVPVPTFGIAGAPQADFGTLLAVLTVSLWLWFVRGQTWASIGLSRPKSTRNTVLWGVGLGFFGFFLQAVLPALLEGGGAGKNTAESAYGPLKGNLPLLLWWLPFIWVSAGFGEEFLYRGYYFQRVIGIVGERWWGIAIAVIASSLFFGMAHSYGGLNHILDASIGGFAACAFFLILRRNLWALMISHALADTLSFIQLFYGWG